MQCCWLRVAWRLGGGLLSGVMITIIVQRYRDDTRGFDGRRIGGWRGFGWVLHRGGLAGGGVGAADVAVVGEGAAGEAAEDGPGVPGLRGARREAAARDQAPQEGRGAELRRDPQAARRGAGERGDERGRVRGARGGAGRAAAAAAGPGAQDPPRGLRGR